MISFYFHSCYNDKLSHNANYVFSSFLNDFRNFKLSHKEYDYEIISDKSPADNILFENISIKDLIMRIPNREYRIFANSIFSKYPIESFYNFDDIFTDNLPNYTLFGEDAINVYIAKKQGRVTLSLPFDDFKIDKLLLCEESGISISVDNFYGVNVDILKTYLPSKDKGKSYLDRIFSLRGEENTYLSDSFINEFTSSSERIQRHLFNLFNSAHSAGLLVPCKSDGAIMKKFKIDDERYIYELRSMSEEGFRICVDSDGDKLYVGLFYTKADYNTHKKQQDRSKCAHRIIKDLKLKSKCNCPIAYF